mgnify:CR=1 FL=1
MVGYVLGVLVGTLRRIWIHHFAEEILEQDCLVSIEFIWDSKRLLFRLEGCGDRMENNPLRDVACQRIEKSRYSWHYAH